MVVRVWHLGVVVLLALLFVGYSITHGSSPSAATTDSTAPQGEAGQNAEANVRSLIPSIESYNADNTPGGKNDPNADHSDKGYTGMTIALLKSHYDQAIPAGDYVNPTDAGFPAGIVKVTPSNTAYCAVSEVDGVFAWKLNPSGVVKTSTTPSAVCAS